MTQTGEDEGQSVTDVNQTKTQSADQSATNGTADETAQEIRSDGDGTGDLATVIAEREDYLDRLQRSMAEFANYRRRVEQDRNRARELATSGILVQLLPIMDDLERALANVQLGGGLVHAAHVTHGAPPRGNGVAPPPAGPDSFAHRP